LKVFEVQCLIYFISDFEIRREIVTKACHQEFILEAPVMTVACCEPGHDFDVAIAVDHLVLAATDQGLGTCWVGWFERDVVKKILKLSEVLEVPILIPIGYPAESPELRTRKTVEEMVIKI
jgi:nitroreductase